MSLLYSALDARFREGQNENCIDSWQRHSRPDRHRRVRDLLCYKCATIAFAVNAIRTINMSTTTIRLEDELKARIAAAAARSGRSSHAFILDALSDMVERSELDEELHRIADKRWAALQRTGESIAWEDAAGYLQARAAGKKARRPSARRPGS